MLIKLKVEAPMSLLAYLRAHCPSYPSVKALKRAIDRKQCKINGCVERFSTHPVRKGDILEINLEKSPESVKSVVLYEDDSIIAYNKSPHTLSDPPKGLFAVHRLDKETSGVLLFAKDLKSQERICALFAERKIEKQYLALVDGAVEKERWTEENLLGKIQSFDGGAIYGSVPYGKNAITHFQCLKKTDYASLVLCKPVTGRTHQIRAHLKESGHPILGDWHYSSRFRCSFEPRRHLLHAYSLNFPGTQIIAPLLEDFQAAYATLFKDPHCQDLRNWRCASDTTRSR